VKIISFDELFPNYADIKNNIDHNKEEGSLTVKASEVYKFLRIETSFDQWFKLCSEDMGLTEGKDYIKTKNADQPVDYLISYDLSKQFCMMSDGNVAHQIRKYFIKSANLYGELMNAKSMEELIKIYTEYIDYRIKATAKINAGLDIDNERF